MQPQKGGPDLVVINRVGDRRQLDSLLSDTDFMGFPVVRSREHDLEGS